MKKNLIALLGLCSIVALMAQEPDQNQDPFDPAHKDEWRHGEDPASAARIAAWKAPAAVKAVIGDKPRPVTLRVIETLEHYQVPPGVDPETRTFLTVQVTVELLHTIPELTNQQILRLIHIPAQALRQ